MGKIDRDRWVAAEGRKCKGELQLLCCFISSGKKTLSELFTCALISMFSGAACEGGGKGEEANENEMSELTEKAIARRK